jgi:zinc protease
MRTLLAALIITLLFAPGCTTVGGGENGPKLKSLSLIKDKPAAITGPIGERYVLDNGIILLVKENHALPVVTVSMIIKAGSVMEPSDEAGLAHLTAGLLTKGADKMSANDISEAIDYIGGSLSTGGSTDYAIAGMKVLKKDIDTGFSLLAKVLMMPAFEQTEVDRLKKAVKAGIIRSEQEPGSVASKAFSKAVFGADNPYGRPVEGTVESIDNITRDDITAFHAKYYAPNNCIMAVVGDITAAEAKNLISKHFVEWPKKEIAAPVVPTSPQPSGVQMVQINRDITQANILMGHIGVNRENPDYYKLYVMNYILGGGGFASRILDKIRDDMGLAYSAYSYFGANKYQGSYTVGLETKNQSAKTAIDETLKIIENMKKEQVTDKELQDAKDYITGSFPRKMDTSSKIAELLAQVEFYNLGLNYFEMYEREITRVTKEDILESAKKYLHPDNIYIIEVANLKEAGEQKQEKQ